MGRRLRTIRAAMTDSPTTGPKDMRERGKALAMGLVVIAWLVFVFAYLLPQVIDYRLAAEAIAATPAPWLVVVLVSGMLGWLSEGFAVGAFLPGLSARQGTAEYLSTAAIGSTIPGPIKLAVAFRLLRDWAFTTEASVLGLSLNGLASQASKLIMPIVAILALSLMGSIPGWGLLLAALLCVPVALGAIVSVWVLRSEAFARRVGAFANRAGTAVMRRVHRPAPDLSDQLLDFRAAAKDLIIARAWRGIATQAIARSAGFVTLLLSLRAVGVPAEVLPLDVVLATYAAVMVITLIPIAPGGAGLPEVLYIGIFTSVAADPGYDNLIGAGTMLFRAVTWFLPIPVGYLTLLIHQRRRGRTRTVETIDEVVPPDGEPSPGGAA
jgi:uncharacterized membrane protein YbhN (UPF0104 family)